MNFNFTVGSIFLVALALYVVADAVITHILNKKEQKRLKKAKELIWSLGMNADLYLPTSVELKDEELAKALTLLGSKGFIITDDEGRLVGSVVAQRLSSDEVA